MKRSILVMVSILSVANIASAEMIRDGIDIDFVTIGNPGNAGDTRVEASPSGAGAVDYEYQLGKYEVTNGQWNAFVSAAGAPTGNDGLNPGDAYDESAHWTGTDVPTNKVSWYEAAQFCNYLTSGDKSEGAYLFSGNNTNPGDFLDVNRDSAISTYGMIYVLPTEDEWYKAAYYTGSGYSTYATGMDTAPDEWSPTGGPNSDGQAAGWNYDYAYPNNSSSNDQPWDVTAGYSPEELNGTFDMMGNVWEWNETVLSLGRGLRGGSYVNDVTILRSSFRNLNYPNYESISLGFRVASVPEPTNHPPVADAGDDQAVYVCIDRLAEVTLNGSDSNDIDGDELSYYWSWMIDDEIYDANGVAPTIELSVGEHIIELIVNDGIEDSEPNEVVVTVIDSIELLIILTDYILDLDLHSGIENSLLAKIDTAFAKLEDDNDKNDKAAATSLQAFINAVEAQSGKKISQDNVDYLIETAQQAIDILCTE